MSKRARGHEWDRQYTAKEMPEVLPHVQRHTLEGQTHSVAPEALAPLLEEFFNG